ncbi:MAG: hypothetical protein M1832_000881 [Thelocarpon impressellum]|nr:MAG: hypothetical protein M1832_000881 [Thelocarpon impressellum]
MAHSPPLPPEIIIHILSLLPRPSTSASAQHTLHSACLVSRAWYASAVPLLYRSPRLSGRNFAAFVATVCPSVNAHVRRSELAGEVRWLDMGALVHDASRSLTARLLGRLKGRLEGLVAPRSSFAINCFAALAKCERLRHLDLTLVCESIGLVDLFRALRSLASLDSFRFPRAKTHDARFTYTPDAYSWPPRLRALYLGGAVTDRFVADVGDSLPLTLTDLTLADCWNLAAGRRMELIHRLGPRLRLLRLQGRTTVQAIEDYGSLLRDCPALRSLSLPGDLVGCYAGVYPSHSGPDGLSDGGHAHLRFLQLDAPSDGAKADTWHANSMTPALVRRAVRCGLGGLRYVRVHMDMAWLPAYPVEDGEVEGWQAADVVDLDALLADVARADGPDPDVGRDAWNEPWRGYRPGVYTFKDPDPFWDLGMESWDARRGR